MAARKELRQRLLILLLVLLVATLLLEFYLPALLQSSVYNRIFTAEVLRAFGVFASFIYRAVSAGIIAVFITDAIRRDERRRQKEDLDGQIGELKRSAIEGVYGRTVEPEVWSILDEAVFNQEIVRKNLKISLHFKITRGRVREHMVWDEDLYNRTDREIVYQKRLSTADHADRCVLEKVEYFVRGEEEMGAILFDRNEESTIILHETDIPVRPNGVTKVRSVYSLNLGFSDRYYQNTIGVQRVVIGVQVDVYKPPGYLFAIESYFGRLKSAHTFDFSDQESISAERLSFFTTRAVFPGTGIEYSLEKTKRVGK